jgi:hypothetical protein
MAGRMEEKNVQTLEFLGGDEKNLLVKGCVP